MTQNDGQRHPGCQTWLVRLYRTFWVSSALLLAACGGGGGSSDSPPSGQHSGTTDTTPPSLAIASPTSAPSYSTTTNTLSVAGTANDNIGVSGITWSNSSGGSGTASGTTSSWSISNITLQNGSNVITITAMDAAGNATDATLTVTYTAPSPPSSGGTTDTTPPSLSITSPTSATSYSTTSSTLSVGGTATDNVGVSTVTWSNSRGSSGTASGTTPWNTGNLTLQNGSNVITITARDAAGNTASKALTVTYNSTPADTAAPSITITSPTSAASHTTTSSTLSLAGTATDNVGVTAVSWSNSRGGSGTASGTTSPWSISSIALQSGSNVITITARDGAGNTASKTLTVTYNSDSTAPIVTITSPTDAASYSTTSSTLSLKGAATDNVGVTTVTWSNSRGGSGTASGTASWSTSNIALQSGSNIITITARDAAGNVATKTLTVTYDNGQSERTTYYISPQGSDGTDGQSPGAPWRSFAKAFSTMVAGDELILLDGTYSEAAGTGHISYTDSSENIGGRNSAQIPSGISQQRPTYIHALNPGNVKIMGALFIGRSTRKDSHITIDGLTFEGGGSLYNSSYITIRNSGFHSERQSAGSVLSIGSNDGNWGNSYILFQDIWVWGKERIGLIVYRSDNVVVRRAVVRNDGCDSRSQGCGSNSGNYMVGTTVYNSFNVSFQNVISVDNVRGAGGYDGAGDFYTAWHDNFIYPWHSNEWLGTISLNSGLSAGYGYDLDSIAAPRQPMATYRDIVAWNVASPFNAQENSCGNNCAAHNFSVSNATLKATGSDGFRISPNMSSGRQDVQNIIVLGSGRFAFNSASQASYVNVFGSWSQGTYNQTDCATGCIQTDPTTTGSLKYITRIESGTTLEGSGADSLNYGATVVNRYGIDDTYFGSGGYNLLTPVALWPWPNETRIKNEMCATTTRGFCSAGQRLDQRGPVTLTSYIWESLGNPVPAGIY